MSWLTGQSLAEKVRKNATFETKNAFLGIYPIDSLPDFIPFRPCLLIVNTHTRNLPGEHWIAILIDEKRNGELFDSLAIPVSGYLIRWLNRFCNKWKTNNKSFQHALSTMCGAYVLYFILNRLHVKDFETITAVFSPLSRVNESFVDAFYCSLK